MKSNSTRKYSRFFWELLPWLIVLILALTLMFFDKRISQKKQRLDEEKQQVEQQAPPAINVVTQLIQPQEMEDSLDLPALVQAWEDLTVKAEVSGKIIDIQVTEGDRVTAGQIIAVIDQRDYQNTLNSLLARQRLASMNFDRLTKLAQEAAVPQSQYDEAQATLDELNASVENSRLHLERCSIRSPISGIVNDLPARSGMLLAYGDPVAQILEINRVKINVSIPESHVNALQNLETSLITIAALNDLVVSGNKTFLASQPTSAAMTYTLQLAVDNTDGKILPGMFSRVRVVIQKISDAYGIPLYAVITQDNEQFVYLVENDLARKREVTTGFFQGWKVLITSGLNSGDQVVIVGHRSLEDNQPVNIVKTVTRPEEINL